MAHSIFDLFKIGVGPSSSHTVGPMVAGNRFVATLKQQDLLTHTSRVRIDLYGSLALTGRGHGTDTACILGLMAETPSEVDPDNIQPYIERVKESNELILAGERCINFDISDDLRFNFTKFLEQHANGMQICAYDKNNNALLSRRYFSIGGGFVMEESELAQQQSEQICLPYAYDSARELLTLCQQENKSIAEIMLANETQLGAPDINNSILNIWRVMDACIKRGIKTPGVLPGSLKLKRRAHQMHQKLIDQSNKDKFDTLDWLNLFAMATNEENAAGGRVVTAPTNGAAGVIPAVLAWYLKFHSKSDEEAIIEFLATAAAIGLLYHRNASISAAEVGCQGEIGVACSMAAAGLAAVMGGTPLQVENAAEIGMEHNLGLTCDPIDGLVQVPCIERNTMGAVKAINASKLALQDDGIHHVHLDDVIATMHQTGLDMMSKYKETSLGGLAINVVAC
ncbi:L-serine ammonia-lyase [Thalassotalea sp. ND16A]|uniref:L-serine ammonia-lyase n=1 Tax=Thalassotalea sp. ND16A TaxID=1535422 RepID=UPI00051A0FE7|nr:L-serine ammonia-lyase [Thalassotalea sp. ND16A]KGK00323.1 L-serine ammonia-lyase [Thalassotalea sp. ND16A]